MGELRIGQGRDAARQYLKDNPDVAEKVEAEVRANAYKLMGMKVSLRTVFSNVDMIILTTHIVSVGTR